MSGSYIEEIMELPDDPIGGASGTKRTFRIQFLGKSANVDFPYTVANELVATQLGIILGLNVPSVMSHTIGTETFVLVQFVDRDPQMKQSPPATAKILADYVLSHPDEAHAAIVFDLFVANNDRAFGPKRRNLLLDNAGKLMLYDQGNACFYRPRPAAGILAGIPRLESVEGDIGNLFDMAHKGNHYWEFLTDWSLVKKCCTRIKQLPDFLIRNIVDRIPHHLDPPARAERERLQNFLLKRRDCLYDQIVHGRRHFPGLTEEP